MMIKCEESTYRDQGRIQNAESKMKARSDPEVKKWETELKRKKRSDAQFKEKEVELKRQRRSDP